ncbi:unnamed protein product, partial [Mesorhabditis belari]|uniref:G-protein coupled receptors family 1 profile domain-containing protein n=1 Tax=Mesorhabditis belari TaxID=2138241 RepID=A0AAF3EA87_9BILA
MSTLISSTFASTQTSLPFTESWFSSSSLDSTWMETTTLSPSVSSSVSPMAPPLPDPALKCLGERQMMLSVHGLSNVLIGYVVPVIALFGISGNILNLTVLLAKNMRTRSNVLLACLAVADVVFLLCMLPDAMANYRYFSFNNLFRKFYLTNKIHLLHLLNWSSAAAIWLILIICSERLIGIRYPLSVRKHKSLLSPPFLVSMTVLLTGLLTFHHNISYKCEWRNFCNGTQYHSMCFHVDGPAWFRNQPNPTPQWIRLYVRCSLEIQAVCVVFIPVLLVFISNLLLIATMRRRARFLAVGAGGGEMTDQHRARTEHKVTLTVCAIVTCFTITQGPSAVIPVVSSLSGVPIEKFAKETTIVTTMVVVGKALNFILFCLSSASFRQRLLFRTKGTLLRRKRTAARMALHITREYETLSTRVHSSSDPKTPLVSGTFSAFHEGTKPRRAHSMNSRVVQIEMQSSPREHSGSVY